MLSRTHLARDRDAALAGDPARVDFGKIEVPTLVISAADDRFGKATTAREIAATVRGAQLLLYPSGGHIWVGHDREVWEAVADFIVNSKKDPAGGS